MLNKLSLLILGLLLLNIVSAQIELSPSFISINAYPGETVYRNISIKTSGNYTVYITSTSPSNITINYSSPLIVEKTKTIAVSFSFPKYIERGVYAISLTGSTDIYVDTPHINQVTTVNGGGIVYRDKIKQNNLTVTKYIENDTKVNQLESEIINLKKEPTVKQSINQLLIGASLILLIVSIVIGYGYYKKRNESKRLKEIAGQLLLEKEMKGGNEENNNGNNNENTVLQKEDINDTPSEHT